jgi:polyhydroxyalkanoate synthesis regulator phasin
LKVLKATKAAEEEAERVIKDAKKKSKKADKAAEKKLKKEMEEGVEAARIVGEIRAIYKSDACLESIMQTDTDIIQDNYCE